MEKNFNVDDLVWARMNKYPPWPGIIAKPDARVKSLNTRNPQHYVYFFGTKNFAWVLDSNIFPHNDDILLTSKSYRNPSKKFLSGIQEMEEAARNFPSSPRSDDLDTQSSSEVDNFSRKRKISEENSSDEEQAVSSEAEDTGISPSTQTLNAASTTQEGESVVITKELRVVLEDIYKKPLGKHLKLTSASGDEEDASKNLSPGIQEKTDASKNLPPGIQEKTDVSKNLSTGIQEKSDASKNLSPGIQEKSDASKNLSTGIQEKTDVSKNFPTQPQEEFFAAPTSSPKKDVCSKGREDANTLKEGNKSNNEKMDSKKAIGVPFSKKAGSIQGKKAPNTRDILSAIFKRPFTKKGQDEEEDDSDFDIYDDTSSESDDAQDDVDSDEDFETKDPYYLACVTQARILKNNYERLLENGPPQGKGGSASSPENALPRVHRRDYFERPSTPPLDLSGMDIPSSRDEDETIKIGFLGLGLMGRAIVKNLLISGFEVIVWNRTASKCEEFSRAGVIICATPGEVAHQCDIIFCCISDVECAMEIVAGAGSVTQGLELCDTADIENKGYVSLTSLDATTSQEIGNVITRFGMKYLEVPMIGTPELAEEGDLLLLASGDRFLFADCEQIFQAFANDVLYLGETVGHASQMRLIHNMFTGILFASLGESMALLERCEISEDTFLHILSMSEFNNPLLLEKSRTIAERAFATGTALRYQQEDLNSALEMATAYSNQTFSIATAANEVFKRAMQRGYKNHDVAAVFLGARY